MHCEKMYNIFLQIFQALKFLFQICEKDQIFISNTLQGMKHSDYNECEVCCSSEANFISRYNLQKLKFGNFFESFQRTTILHEKIFVPLYDPTPQFSISFRIFKKKLRKILLKLKKLSYMNE